MVEQQTTNFTYVHIHRVLLQGMQVTTHYGIKHLEATRCALDRYKLLDRFLQGSLGHFLKMPLVTPYFLKRAITWDNSEIINIFFQNYC